VDRAGGSFVRSLSELRPDAVGTQAGGEVEDLGEFLHLRRVDLVRADSEDQGPLPPEQPHLTFSACSIDVTVLCGIQEVASGDLSHRNGVRGLIALLARSIKDLDSLSLLE